MASILQVATIKPQDGAANAIEIANSSANVTIGNLAGTFNGTIGTSASGFGLVTDVDQWRLTSELTGAAGFITTSNMEQNDDQYAHIGGDMVYSSGVFTFPKAGVWWVIASFSMQGASAQNYGGGYIQGTTNNSSYSALSFSYGNFFQSGAWSQCSTDTFFDCQDPATHKVKMYRDVSNADIKFKGSTSDNMTTFTFIRLGDT
jgi:hypothetical protein